MVSLDAFNLDYLILKKESEKASAYFGEYSLARLTLLVYCHSALLQRVLTALALPSPIVKLNVTKLRP